MCLGSFIHSKLISTAVSHFFGCSLQRYVKKKNSLTKHISPLVANIFILRFTIFKYLGEFPGVFLRKWRIQLCFRRSCRLRWRRNRQCIWSGVPDSSPNIGAGLSRTTPCISISYYGGWLPSNPLDHNNSSLRQVNAFEVLDLLQKAFWERSLAFISMTFLQFENWE